MAVNELNLLKRFEVRKVKVSTWLARMRKLLVSDVKMSLTWVTTFKCKSLRGRKHEWRRNNDENSKKSKMSDESNET